MEKVEGNIPVFSSLGFPGVNIVGVVFNVVLLEGVTMSGYLSGHCLVAWTLEGRRVSFVGFLCIF